jgi:hypothetical protein
MTDAFVQSAQLGDLNGTMLEMVAACHISEDIQITKSHCSVYVVTRWFSGENSIASLLQREAILSTLNLTDFKGAERRKVAKANNAENFTKMKMLRRLTSPFTKCVRFFEGRSASILYVQSVLAHSEAFLTTDLRVWITQTDGMYEDCVDLFLMLLNHRRQRHLDAGLLRAGCRLTSVG